VEQFGDRDVELDRLTDCYESGTTECIVIHGRRRLGESEVVRRSIADREDAVHHRAVESTARNRLEGVVDAATAQRPSSRTVRRDREALLETVGDDDATVVIGGPFPVEADESIPSLIQRVRGMEPQEAGMTPVLVGSSNSHVEDEVRPGGAPPYGRATATADLAPLSVADAVFEAPGEQFGRILRLRPEIPPRLQAVAVAVDPSLTDVVSVVEVRDDDVVHALVGLSASVLHRLSPPGDDQRHAALAGDSPLPVDLLRVLQVDAVAALCPEDDRGVAGVLVVRPLVVERERREDDAHADLVAVVDRQFGVVSVGQVVEELSRRGFERLLLDGDGRIAKSGGEL
jgi:hypothetical protein